MGNWLNGLIFVLVVHFVQPLGKIAHTHTQNQKRTEYGYNRKLVIAHPKLSARLVDISIDFSRHSRSLPPPFSSFYAQGRHSSVHFLNNYEYTAPGIIIIIIIRI